MHLLTANFNSGTWGGFQNGLSKFQQNPRSKIAKVWAGKTAFMLLANNRMNKRTGNVNIAIA